MPKRKKVADPREEEDILSTEQSRIKHTEMLNSSFFRWIQDQYANHRAEFWRNGLEEYLQYGREIQAKFPVTADSQADAPSTSTAGAAQNSKPQQPAAFPAPWPAASSSQPALVNSLTHHHQAAENAAPSTAAPDTSASPKSVHGFNAPTQPAPLSPGGTSSAAPQQSNSFSFPSVPSTNSLSPIPAASQGKQQVSSLSNHHLLPESTQGTDTHSSPPTSISTVATLTPPVDLPAASSTSLSGPSLAVSSMPSTSGSQSTPLGVSQMPIGSPFTFASPTTTADMSSPVATSQPLSMGTTAAFAFASGSRPAFGGTSQAASAAASGPFPFSFGSGQPSATTTAGLGASQSSAFGNTLASASLPTFGTSAAAAASSQPSAIFSLSSSPPVTSSTVPAAGAASSQPAFGPGASGASQPAFGSGTFGSSQPAFGSGRFTFGSSQPVFGLGSAPSGSRQPAFGSPLPASSAGQPRPVTTVPITFGTSQPAAISSAAGASSALAGGMSFTWGPPKISLISGDAGGAAADGNGLGTAAAPFGTASALFGTAAAPPSSGRSSGQNGITTDFGAAAHTNGTQEEDEQAEPEEAVLYEKKEGVLLSLELKWRHNMNGKWAKTRQGKVLVCHPSGAAKPYLQFQTSGQVVATAYVQTPLTQQKDPSQLLGALSVSFRHVDKESEKESYDKPQVLSTLMYCASADAAKQLSDKMPAPKRS
ncbi:TPA: hypothetical protein ACH3X2_012568 [Trebouxia sp. C0005]